MMKDIIKTNLILFKLGEYSELVSTVSSYEKNNKISNLIVEDIETVKVSLQENPHGLLLFSVKTKADFQSLVTVFKLYLKEIKSGKLKLALVQTKKNHKIEAILRKFGCNEFLDADINQKSLKFKVDFWTRNILKNLEKEKQKELSYSRREAANKRDAKLAEVRRANFKDIDPLKEEVDIWISRENNCKKVLSKWLISMHGPSPHIAHWESCGNDTWKFLINEDSKTTFYQAEGHWYFDGLKPEFNWKDKVWSFSSQNAKLYFEGSGIECKRLFVDDYTLNITQNSKYANLLSNKILESAQSSFNIERSKQKKDLDEQRFREEAEKKEYLEGDSSTENIDSHMRGETEGEQALDNLKGKIKELEKKHSDLKNKMKNASKKAAQDLKGEIKEIERRKNKLNGELKEIAKKEAANLEGQIKELEKQNESLKDKMKKALQEESNDLTGELAEKTKKSAANLEGQIKELEKKHEKLKNKMKKASEKEAGDLAGEISEIEKRKANLSGSLKEETKKEASDLKGKIEKTQKSESKKDRLKEILEKEVNSRKTSTRDKKNINQSITQTAQETEENFEDRADTVSQDASVIVRLASKKNNAVYLCQLEDLQEELLYISYKSLDLPRDDEYRVTLTMDYGSKKVSINTKGKIKELEEEIYCLDIDRIETSALNNFMTLYEERQNNIFEFLKMARGF